MKCMNCGNQIYEGSKTCWCCGYPVKQEKKSNGWIIPVAIAGGATILFLIGIIVVLGLKLIKGSHEQVAVETVYEKVEDTKEDRKEAVTEKIEKTETKNVTEATEVTETTETTEVNGEEEITEEPEDDEAAATVTPDTCMDGKVKVTVESWSRADSSVTIRIENNSNDEVSVFGFPNIIIDGRTIELDQIENMRRFNNADVSVAPGTYALVDYVVDSSFFEKGGEITGELFAMGFYSDRTYRIKIER